MKLLLFLAACGGSSEPVSPAPDPAPAPEPAPAGIEGALPEVELVAASREGVTPTPMQPDELADTRATLKSVVEDHARAPDNPWAVTHGMLALGSDVELSNGEPAVPFLFSTYGKTLVIGGDTAIGFPSQQGSIRIEPHTDLILKALAESGVSPDQAVIVEGEELAVAALYRYALWRTWVDGDRVSASTFNDTPWTLQALATWAPPELAWTAQGDREMTLDGFTEAVLDDLAEQTAFMKAARASGETVQKKRQGIFAYTCGGAHLLQGAAYAVGRGFGPEDGKERIAAEMEILFWRLDLELKIVDDAIESNPDYALLLLGQRLKFLGHFLETGHKLAAMELYVPTPEQESALERAATELAATVAELEQRGAFTRMGEIRESNEQLYLDLVGDSAHALRGIDMATGAASIRY